MPTQGGRRCSRTKAKCKCGLNDGVEYVLRFGEIAGAAVIADEDKEEGEKAADDKDSAEKKDGDKKDDANKEKGVDRFIMVSAQFRKDLIPQPELQPLPEGSEPSDDKPAEAEEAKPADAPKRSRRGRRMQAPQAEPPKTDSAAAMPRSVHSRVPIGRCSRGTRCCWPSPMMHSLLRTRNRQLPTRRSRTPTETPADAAAATKKPDAPVDPDAVAEAEEKAKAAKEAERKRIKEDNKRKQDEYDKKVEAGEKRVQGIERPICRLVLRHLGQHLQEDSHQPRSTGQEEDRRGGRRKRARRSRRSEE